ncbi:MAG: glycosyltransferase family 9 protein [Synergistaceae bacterium]|nr:glycosyltransferase family 9 protein [Synergistaceae bacterium]
MLLAQNWQVVLIGGKQEIEISDALSPEILSKCINYVGKTSVAESIALESLCNVSVGVDTGMQHVSDALGVKTVSIFGPTNPKTHGAYSNKAVFAEVDEPCKYCFDPSNQYMYINCNHRKCLERVTPEQVFELISLQLNE